MGKKRKAAGKPIGGPGPDSDEDKEFRTKLNINSYEDVAHSEDEFHLNRDRILLEDSPVRKRQRRIEERGQALCASE